MSNQTVDGESHTSQQQVDSPLWRETNASHTLLSLTKHCLHIFSWRDKEALNTARARLAHIKEAKQGLKRDLSQRYVADDPHRHKRKTRSQIIVTQCMRFELLNKEPAVKSILPPLYKDIRKRVSQKSVPTCFKTATIVAVPKKNNSGLDHFATGYRYLWTFSSKQKFLFTWYNAKPLQWRG